MHRRARRGTTGLFHLALLVPDRAELARSLRRVTEAGLPVHRRVRPPRLRGAVPERPRGQRDRDLPRPATRGVEPRRRRAAADGDAAPRPRRRARERARRRHGRGDGAGHAHRPRAPPGRVDPRRPTTSTSARSASTRWCARYPGALFVSAGGYHHHLGLNTWAGEGVPAPPPDARGLRSFTIVLPDDASLSATLEAAAAAGVEIDLADGRATVTDPSGNAAVLTTRYPDA